MSGNSNNKDKFLFVPTPRQLNRNDFINYNKSVVVAHWKAATAASRKDSELYDCTLEGLSRASRVELMLMGGGLLWLSPCTKMSTTKRYLLDDYGLFSIEVPVVRT